jgi:hypothetical protein
MRQPARWPSVGIDRRARYRRPAGVTTGNTRRNSSPSVDPARDGWSPESGASGPELANEANQTSSLVAPPPPVVQKSPGTSEPKARQTPTRQGRFRR